ncbi:isocitrate lyase/phosphoenolpyruvate mutase family protein [Paenibacillus sp. JCM 10914]|uniref:isocitrate lyase/PEP mutase family protein n=1 Tax=Paenibacillus sp. JCM 10914 TaxID=1236974 RepID=UPI0003CC7FEC|nr:isocitrate lyase/phosphoenolpyruvate mutase family protein [Paenibacillus sp. JCM 10914]GAE06252.1 probable carboxyvinyl-carboxyphosphonate phosphorylmutase [Paenibacillus sp. JCM 10914]
MKNQLEQARIFHELHRSGRPLILVNAWDSGSARTVQQAGAGAIATGSWAVAAAHGYDDGEKLPFDLVLSNLKRIHNNVDLPITIDIEGGYGRSPEIVKNNVLKIIECGAIGVNIEDQWIDGTRLYSEVEQALRIAAVRDAAQYTSIPLFINARTDIFFQVSVDAHNEDHVEAALQRATVYAEAGAHGIFVPGLCNEKLIDSLCQRSPIPVNVMKSPESPSLERLAALGVARISYGPYLYLLMMDALKQASAKALAFQEL